MAKDNKKKARDKAAEKAVKARIGSTHLKSFRILGSEKDPDTGVVTVHILRMVGSDNYLFRVKCEQEGGSYSMSGLLPVTNEEDFGEYRVYNPKPASAEALRPTEKEKKFTGYGK